MTQRVSTLALVGILFCLPQFAHAATPASATEDEKRAAQKMFEAGDGLYESGRFEDAIAAFKNSHDLVSSPNSRLMLARSLREAGRNSEACREFRGTIGDAEASGGRYPEALQAAQSELKALEAQMAQGSQVGAAAPTTTVPAASATTQPAPSTATANRSSAPASSPPPPAPAPSSTMRTAAWISAGVGVAGLSAFGIFGYLDKKTHDALESECRNALCSPSSLDKADTGRRYQLLANVGLGVAAVGAVAATTLFILSPRKEPGSTQLALKATPTGLVVDGRF